jgi:hypothetical protein
MFAEPGWCGVCGLPVPAEERFCRWPFGARPGDGPYDGEAVPGASHSLAFMTELVELQHWKCPWCQDYLPDSPRGTAIDHIIPRVYGGPHRRGRRRGPRPGPGRGEEPDGVLPRSKGPCRHQGSSRREPGPLTVSAS